MDDIASAQMQKLLGVGKVALNDLAKRGIVVAQGQLRRRSQHLDGAGPVSARAQTRVPRQELADDLRPTPNAPVTARGTQAKARSGEP